MTIDEATKAIADMRAELKGRGEVLDAIKQAAVEGIRMDCVDWREKLRAFGRDSEQHKISAADWKANNDGIHLTLYALGGFYVAYFADAEIIWESADDEHPMYHVDLQIDPPHRTCIHRLHLADWLDHLAETRYPVRVMPHEDLAVEDYE
jgi:hypothetical protein